MPIESLGAAEQAFPEVDSDTLAKILDMTDEPSISFVARVLDQAAEQGKVPNRDYRQMAADNLVDSEDLPAGVDSTDILDGLEGVTEAQERDWEQLAAETARNGDADDLVQLHNKMDSLSKKLLKEPTTTSVPKNLELGVMTVVQELDGRIGEAFQEYDRDRLATLHAAVKRLDQDGLRDHLEDRVQSYRAMLNSDGEDYEMLVGRLTDEEITVHEMLTTAREISAGKYDVTPEQAQELLTYARDALAEHKEIVRQLDEDAAGIVDDL